MNWQDTRVFIINRDNMNRGFIQLLTWLASVGMRNVAVIDNGSTYPPVLDLYGKLSNVQLLRSDENLGPYAFWQLGLHQQQHERFIVTDPDVVPSADCPDDLIERMHQAMDREHVGKVGPSLRIDNLPDSYARKSEVIAWEKQFWLHPAIGQGAYHADIDTTFALYQPHSECRPAGHTLRLAPPYSVEHRPWYEDSAHPPDEAVYYRSHAKADLIHW